MDWQLIWQAVGTIIAATVFISGIFNFVRNTDLKNINEKFEDLEVQIQAYESITNTKLSEAEFRRFEDKYEKAIENLQKTTTSSIGKLEEKLDAKFDKLFDILIDKK